MMVDHHLLSLARGEHILHVVQASSPIEVETEHEVGFLKYLSHLLRMLVVTHHLAACPRQPTDGVGYEVGHADLGLLAQRAQIMRPTKGGTYRITIRRLVAADDNMLRSRYHLLEGSGFLF